MFLNSQGGISDYNRAAGIDAGFFLGQNLTIIGLLAKTESPDEVLAKVPDGTDLAATVDVNYKTDKFNTSAQYQDIGERFNAEMGFVPRLDIRSSKAKAA